MIFKSMVTVFVLLYLKKLKYIIYQSQLIKTDTLMLMVEIVFASIFVVYTQQE